MQTNEIAEVITIKTQNESKNKECEDIGNQETWRPIKGLEGYYEVSNHGNVKSVERIIYGRVYPSLKLKHIDNKGYLMVRMSKHSTGIMKLVHRLVALHYIENPNNYPDVNHKDLNKANNHVSNLEWVSEKQNTSHAIKNGRMNFIYGENNKKSKLKLKDVEIIRKRYWEIKISTKEIAVEYNVSKTCINRIIKNETWQNNEYKNFLDKQNEPHILGRNRGTKNGQSKLNEEKVKEIRKLRVNGESLSKIAKKFDVCPETINAILKKKNWSYVT